MALFDREGLEDLLRDREALEVRSPRRRRIGLSERRRRLSRCFGLLVRLSYARETAGAREVEDVVRRLRGELEALGRPSQGPGALRPSPSMEEIALRFDDVMRELERRPVDELRLLDAIERACNLAVDLLSLPRPATLPWPVARAA